MSRYITFNIRWVRCVKSLESGTLSMELQSPLQPLPCKRCSYIYRGSHPGETSWLLEWILMFIYPFRWALNKEANSVFKSIWVPKHKTQESWGKLNFRQCAHLVLEIRMSQLLIQIMSKQRRSVGTWKNPQLSLIKRDNVSASELKVQLQSILIFLPLGANTFFFF